jgi:hypothetical protein
VSYYQAICTSSTVDCVFAVQECVEGATPRATPARWEAVQQRKSGWMMALSYQQWCVRQDCALLLRSCVHVCIGCFVHARAKVVCVRYGPWHLLSPSLSFLSFAYRPPPAMQPAVVEPAHRPLAVQVSWPPTDGTYPKLQCKEAVAPVMALACDILDGSTIHVPVVGPVDTAGTAHPPPVTTPPPDFTH